ncbi:MAG: hypothetical protein IH846_03000, partial [Acidobacteria bacterium]|nr:hypothetical protein [Acidobacteriota bacterium]
MAVDSDGNVLAVDLGNNLVVKISPGGVLTVVAGNGIRGFSGDGGPATSASLNQPSSVAVDTAGNLYIVDKDNQRIRKVTSGGTITTVAGNGDFGFTGDGGQATSASLNFPRGVAVDADGNLYIADTYSNRIRKVTPGGTITTVAGSGSADPGAGGPATSALLDVPTGVAVDGTGNLYIADGSNRVRRISSGGIIDTVAGTGIEDFSGDEGPATSATLNQAFGVAVDGSGNLYIADTGNNRIRRVALDGTITTVAGSGGTGRLAGALSGDGGPATSARLNLPSGVAVDAGGSLYIADTVNQRVRKVSSTGTITTLAGNNLFKFSGDGGPATSASLNFPTSAALDALGNLYIADLGNHRVRKVTPGGTITTVAGSGPPGAFSGDGGSATSASLNLPSGVAVDAAGNLFIADLINERVRKVSANGIITTVAGNGGFGFSGDGGQATDAELARPADVAVNAAGDLYIADTDNNRVRKVSSGGIITTVAGNGVHTGSIDGEGGDPTDDLGDDGPATSASLRFATGAGGVAVDADNNLYIADTNNGRIRKVTPGGTISTVAGSDAPCCDLSDGGPATSAWLGQPTGVAVDAAGNLYIAHDGLIRKVTNGTITTVAGSGCCFGGDGGPATSASLNGPEDVAVDAAGNLYIADSFNDRIRLVLAGSPSFSAAPASLNFSAPAESAEAPSQQIAVSSSVTGLAWTAQASTGSGGPWLIVLPAAGSAPGLLEVSVDVAGLAPGTYTGTVTLQAPLGTPPTQTVSVELTVEPALPAQIAVEPSSLTFEAAAGAGDPPEQTLRISNAGGGTLDWTAQASTLSGGDWLSVSLVSGSVAAGSPAVVQVSAKLAGLSPGVYSGSVRVESPSANQQQTVAVALLLSEVTQTLLVSKSGLLFTGVEGGGVAPSQTIEILNTGQGVMSWTAEVTTTSGGNWLTVSPSGGSSDAASLEASPVKVSATAAGLPAGNYSGLIQVSATGASNSPQFVSVVLNVLPAGNNPGVLVQPAGLIFAAQAGPS